MESTTILTTLTPHTYLRADSIHKEPVTIIIEGMNDSLTHNTKAHDTLIILLIDTSGSMYGDKIDTIKLAISYLLDNVDESCEIVLIRFATSVTILTPRPVKTDQAGIQLLKYLISTLYADGKTNITNAIEYALIYSDSRRDTQILVFTDGKHNMGITWNLLFSKCDFSAAPLHTFSIGDEPDGSILMNLSSRSAGGSYEHIQSAREVLTVIGRKIGYLRSKIYTNCMLELEAYNGCRISDISNISSACTEIVYCKRYQFKIGNINAGAKRMFIIDLSIRNLTDTEIADTGPRQRLLDIKLFTGPSMLVCNTISMSRTDPLTRPISVCNKQKIIEVALHTKIKNTITAAISYAESSNFITACNIIDEMLALVNQYDIGSDTITNHVVELECIRNRIINKNLYDQDRNSIYSIHSAYTYQQSGIYTTIIESLSGDDISNKVS